MPTSSITKKFVITDKKAYEELLNAVNQSCAPKVNQHFSSLKRDREALSRFSLQKTPKQK